MGVVIIHTDELLLEIELDDNEDILITKTRGRRGERKSRIVLSEYEIELISRAIPELKKFRWLDKEEIESLWGLLMEVK